MIPTDGDMMECFIPMSSLGDVTSYLLPESKPRFELGEICQTGGKTIS